MRSIPRSRRKKKQLFSHVPEDGAEFFGMARFAVRAQKSGVMLLAGTGDVPLNDELEDYAKAGVPTDEILRAATINGAMWLGHGAEFGTVEVNKRADLLIVDGA